MSVVFLITWDVVVLNLQLVNRFAGTRLEDLRGEIPGLCKDQHGCRYLQKKLEEGVPEHRDMIFHETFGHFADLMTGTARLLDTIKLN